MLPVIVYLAAYSTFSYVRASSNKGAYVDVLVTLYRRLNRGTLQQAADAALRLFGRHCRVRNPRMSAEFDISRAEYKHPPIVGGPASSGQFKQGINHPVWVCRGVAMIDGALDVMKRASMAA